MEGIQKEKLIIEGLKEPISIEDIINHFKDCGPIDDVIIYNSNNFISAEIYFKDNSSLIKSLNKNSTKINNSIIKIRIEESDNNEDNNIYSTTQHKYNTRLSEKRNKKLIIEEKNEKDEINDIINEEEELNESLSIDDQSIDNDSNTKNKENKNEIIDDKLDISDISEENISEEEEDNISNNEGYNNFMKEYKQYCKGIKKAINKQIEGEINVQDLLIQANNLYLNSNYPKAKEVLETIISVYPNMQEPYLILSQIYEEEKNDEKSLFFLMLAAQSSGGDKNIWIKCCNYNKKLKNIRQAEYCITRALKLDKKNLYILYERGALNEELGDIFKAIRIYTVLLKLYPNYDILLHIIILYERTQNYEKAIKLFEDFFDKLPRENKLKAVIFLYELYLKYKEYLKGYNFYEKNIMELKEKDTEVYNNIINNSNFKLKKLFCFLYLSITKEEKDENKLIELKFENILEQIMEEFNFVIKDENEAKYGENYLGDNLNLLFKILEECDKINEFEKIYDELEKEMIKQIKFMDHYKNVISQVKFQLGNYYFNKKLFDKSVSLLEESLKYFNSSDDKIKNFILIKLSESYNKIGNKQKAINILNTTTSKSKEKINIKSDINILKSKINILEEIKANDKEKDKNNIEIKKEEGDSIISSLEEKENDNDDYDDFIKKQIHEKINDEEMEAEESEEEINIKEKEKKNNNKINKEEYNIFEEELNINNKNNILNINDIFSNEKSENLLESKIMDNFLSKKRKYCSSFLHKYSPNDLIKEENKKEYDFSFDNYLHRRIRNSNKNIQNSTVNNNTSIYDLNLNDLKEDYDKLNIEIKNNVDQYLKLQESLLFLNNKEIDKFLEISYEPLKVILSQELEIENYLKDLFRYLLEKSNIKNYFHNKSNIFEKSSFDDNIFFSNNNINNISNINTSINNHIINLEENEDDNDNVINNKNNNINEEIKSDNNLFIRKSTNKIFLTKKKIKYTKNFIEKELNSLNILPKYISYENFKQIISHFIKYSYERGQNEQAFKIIILILNSYKIINKNDYFCYDAVIYCIMICYKKNLYKTSLELLKNSIIKYDLQFLPFFWVQLWNICNNISSSIARSYMYKLAINKSISNNPLLKLIISLCYYKTNYFEFSISNLEDLMKKYKDNSYLYFLTSLSYLHFAQNKRTKNKHEKFFLMKKYFFSYKIKRNYECPIEVLYNEGRLYQYLGMYDIAWNKYQELYDNIDQVEYLNNETKKKIKYSTVYNMHLILIKSGNEKRAQEFLYNNLII